MALGLTLLCLYPIVTIAQYNSTESDTVVYRKNVVKMNLGGLALKSYNFSYERLLSKKISFIAGYNTMSQHTLSDLPLLKKLAESVLDEDDDIRKDFNKITVANNAYTGEFRFYMGGKAGARGFYFALYGRYAETKVNYDYNYKGSVKNYEIPLKSKISSFGGGALMGSQFIIAKRVALDFYVGAHYGRSSGPADAVTNLGTLTAQEKSDLKDKIEAIAEINGKKYLTATVTDEGVNAKVKGPFVGLRAGVSIGIAF